MTFYYGKNNKHKERKVNTQHSISQHCSYQLAAQLQIGKLILITVYGIGITDVSDCKLIHQKY